MNVRFVAFWTLFYCSDEVGAELFLSCHGYVWCQRICWPHADLLHDDGNGLENDGCTNQCEFARCGDGIVFEAIEIERERCGVERFTRLAAGEPFDFNRGCVEPAGEPNLVHERGMVSFPEATVYLADGSFEDVQCARLPVGLYRSQDVGCLPRFVDGDGAGGMCLTTTAGNDFKVEFPGEGCVPDLAFRWQHECGREECDDGNAINDDACSNTHASNLIPRLQIGNGNESLTRLPFYGLYDYSQGGMLYQAEELLAAGAREGGMIESIAFEFGGWRVPYRAENQTIRMFHTDAAEPPRRSLPSYQEIGVRDEMVVKAPFQFLIVANGWMVIPWDRPFPWDGVSNLVISWESRDGHWESGYGWLKGDGRLNARSQAWYADDGYPVRDSSFQNGRPNLKIIFPE